MSDITKADIRTALLGSLKTVLAKREQEIKVLRDKEAIGAAKLEKGEYSDSLKASVAKLKQAPDWNTIGTAAKNNRRAENLIQHNSEYDKKIKKNDMANDNGALPELGKDEMAGGTGDQGMNPSMEMAEPKAAAICIGCTGSNTEPLGDLGGQSHHICKDCGEIGTTVREENAQAEANSGNPVMAKEEPLATMRAPKAKGISSLPAPKSKMVVKAELPNVEAARQAVGIAGNGPKLPSVAKPKSPSVPGAKPIKDAFNTGGANKMAKEEDFPVRPLPAKTPLSDEANEKISRSAGFKGKFPMKKSEKTPFNDGAGTTGKPHEVIPGSDVAVDAARPNTEPPKAGKEISAEGSGGTIKKDKMVKDEVPAGNPDIQPTVREKVNAKKGVTSLATIRQRWHGAGKMDSNDMVAKLKPILANLPNLHASIDKLAAAVGGGSGNAKGVAGPKPISTVGKGQYRVGSTPPGKGGFKAVDQAAQSMGKAEGIPSAPKAPGSSLPAAAKASATQAVKTSPAAPTSATKL